MPNVIDVTVKGLIETQQRMRDAAVGLSGQEMYTAMRKATLLVERDAKIGAPADTGQLRMSITSDVRTVSGAMGSQAVEGVVGSAKSYAPYMELGTGVFAGRPAVKMPPPDAVAVWGRRHGGMSGFMVARAIWKAGGLKPRKYLQNAFSKNQSAIVALIGEAVTGIVNKANGS